MFIWAKNKSEKCVCMWKREREIEEEKESRNSRMTTEEKRLASREKMKFPLPGRSSRRVRSSSPLHRRKYRFSWTMDSLSLFFFLSSFFKEDRQISHLRFFVAAPIYPDFKILITRLFKSLRCYIFDARNAVEILCN